MQIECGEVEAHESELWIAREHMTLCAAAAEVEAIRKGADYSAKRTWRQPGRASVVSTRFHVHRTCQTQIGGRASPMLCDPEGEYGKFGKVPF